jgi:hypothetical protein
MPTIYAAAERVLVHLGLQADGSEALPDLLGKTDRIPFQRVRKIRAAEFLYHGLPPPEDNIWKVLSDFFCRPWFLRIWVVQEVVLAREVRFICGHWELTWSVVANAAKAYDMLISQTPYGVWTRNNVKARYSTWSLDLMLKLRLTRSTVAKRLADLKGDIESVPRRHSSQSQSRLSREVAAKRELVVRTCQEHSILFQALERIMLSLADIRPSSTPIVELLVMFARNEATRPEDRLYALVGLASDITLEEFPPNYEETNARTNARFAKISPKRTRHGSSCLRYQVSCPVEEQGTSQHLFSILGP